MKKAEEANAYYTKQPAKMNVYDAGESVKDMPIKKTEESHKKCSPGEFCMHKEGSALAFGRKVAEAMDMPFTREGYNQVAASSMGGSVGLLGGGAAGAGLGALHGLISPGETVGRDDAGNSIVKKRNRLMGALRGGLAGGAGGALGGMALGMGGGALAEKYNPGTLKHFFPDMQARLTETYNSLGGDRYNK
jgi:hypothetical protein